MAALLQWQQTWNGTVLNWVETWGEGASAFSIVPAASFSFDGHALLPAEASFAATGAVTFLDSTYAAGSVNLSGSFGALFEGTTKVQPAAFSIQPAFTLAFSTAVGAAFSIVDNGTVMEPAAGSIASSDVISVSSAVPLWTGADAQDFISVSVASVSSVTFDSSPAGTATVYATSASSLAFAASPLYGADFTIAAATTATPWVTTAVQPRTPSFAPFATVTFGPYSRAEGAFKDSATGFVEFGQTAGALGSGAVSTPATASLAFTGQSRADAEFRVDSHLSGEFGQPGGGVEFGALVLTHQLTLNFGAESEGQGSFLAASHSSFGFSSTNFVAEDDDLKSDARPEIFWQAAAQQEAWERDRRRIRKIARIDEDDLLTLSAALSQAVSQATSGIRPAA